MTEGKEHLKLLEKQPGYGNITVLVGPDGGGKTFLSQKLLKEDTNAVLISGTHPNTWPITETEKVKIARIKDREKSYDYYGLLSLALHKVVLEQAKSGHNVIVDSDQTFKWLMWKDMDNNLDAAISALTSSKINVVLPDTIRYVVPEAKDFDKQAKLIWEQQKMKKRSEISDIDPKNLKQVKQRLHASEHVIIALEKIGVKIEGKPNWLNN